MKNLKNFMTNRDLMTKWKELKIKFKSEKKPIPMLEMFLVCVGETEIDVQGKKEIVVGFYQGFAEEGSPAYLFSSDQKNRCYTYGLDSKKNTHVKSLIGKFIKLK
jgi:hypothetical protein